MKPNKTDCGYCVNWLEDGCTILRELNGCGGCGEFDNKHIIKQMIGEDYTKRDHRCKYDSVLGVPVEELGWTTCYGCRDKIDFTKGDDFLWLSDGRVFCADCKKKVKNDN